MMEYTTQSAQDAIRTGYGDKEYWDYLERMALEYHAYYMARGLTQQAQAMLTQSLSEALMGNDGI